MAKKKEPVVAKNATTEKKKTITEEKKEWKPSGRILEGVELKEYLKSFSDIEESIKGLK